MLFCFLGGVFISLHFGIPTTVCCKKTSFFKRVASQQKLRTTGLVGRHQHFAKKHTTVELAFRGPVSCGKFSNYVTNCAHLTQYHTSYDHEDGFSPL
jgi:hypothetical protein